jgi:hypothetical protein
MAIRGPDEVSRLGRSLIYKLSGASDRQDDYDSNERKGSIRRYLSRIST